MTRNILEKLAATNPECEVWWDSSPLVYESWARDLIAGAGAGKRAVWAEQLKRMFDPQSAGSMFFRSSTTNPPLSFAAMRDSPRAWAKFVRACIEESPDAGVEEIYWMTYKEVLRRGAAMIRPNWEASGGTYGYISGQVDARFVYDYDSMHRQALELAQIAPNVMVKIPGSKEGYRLIEDLTARGIATNNTMSFAVPQYMCLMESVSRGLERAKKSGVDISCWRSVITHMSARMGSLGDMQSQATARGIVLSPADVRWAEIAVFKRAYFWGRERNHPSKMLQCSMRVDTDVERGRPSSWHVQKIAGSNSVYTCPPGYIAALMEVEDDIAPFDPDAINEPVPAGVLDKLLKIPSFVQAYEFDGMSEDEFGRYGAFLATAREFTGATREMVDFVAQQFRRMDRKVRGKGQRA